MAGVLRAGKGAHHQVTHGGQHQIVAGGPYGSTVAVHDGEVWRRVNRNGSMTRKPEWTDELALAHGEKRAAKDFQEQSQRDNGIFRDRRNQQLYPTALKPL